MASATNRKPLGEYVDLFLSVVMAAELTVVRYFNCPRFSDAIIKCGDKEFKAHRLTLSTQSEFFHKTFREVSS